MKRRSGLVVHRALGHRLLIVAASTTALFAVTVLAALGGYAASVTGKEVRATLTGASFNGAGTRISTTVTARDVPATQRKIVAALADVYGHIPTAISLSARGDSYVAPGQERSTHPELTAFATYSGIENHAKLTAGRWPADTTTGTIEVALPVPAARAMRLTVGRTVTLHSRVEGPAVTVKVTGLFAVDHPDDYFWGGDRLVTTGTERLGYTTFGPLIVPTTTFSTRFTTSVTARWLVFPSVEEIRAGQLTHVAERARALPTVLGKGPTGTGYAVTSGAPDLLIRVDRALLVARSTLLIPALQLVVLAVYALILVARLMTEHRRVEISLMRARGAAGRQIAGLAIGEGLLLCVPAAVAAPFLAPPLVRAVTTAPMLKASGTRLDLAPSVLMWGIAIAAALACAIAITLPPLRGIRQTYVGTLAERGRGNLRGAIQRAGGDVVLVVLAALAIWQLSHYGGPVTGTTSNELGIDPLIVAGPALALLAGGVMLLRLVPLVSRVAERITAHSRGVAAAVGTRQVSRRPLRAAGPALLLVMTVAVGVLSVATEATWRQSQVDQADFQAGTDLRITAPNDQSAPAPAGQGGVYARLPGVTAVSPVLRNNGSTGSTDVTVLAVDADKLGGMLRTDAGLPAGAPIAHLAAGRANSAQVPVPGRPARLVIDVRIDSAGGSTPVDLSMIISDGLHASYEIRLDPTPADGKSHTRVVDLAGLAGKDGVISYPFAVQGFRFGYVRSLGATPTTLTVTAIRPDGDGGSGPALTVPAASHWAGQYTMSGLGDSLPFRRGGLMTARLPTASDPYVSEPEVGGTAIVRHGAAAETDLPQPAPIPAIVTTALASRAHLATGSRLSVGVNGVEQPITVAGIVPALPSTSVDTPGVLVDWTALDGEALMAGTTPNNPTEWWLAARSGDTGPAARVLGAHPAWSAGTVDRIVLRHQLRDAPLGGALQGALVLGFAAALVFAAIGFAVNTAVSARERVGEFAILRALGVSGRQVLGLVAVEQAFLVGLGLAGGVLLGIVIAHLVVPHVVLTARATAPYPPAHVILQWPVIPAMLGGVVVLLVAILLLLVRSLRRRGLAQAVGLGEDR